MKVSIICCGVSSEILICRNAVMKLTGLMTPLGAWVPTKINQSSCPGCKSGRRELGAEEHEKRASAGANSKLEQARAVGAPI